jgi:hypothetical protein
MNIKPKKSQPIKKKILDALKKVNIKNKTEFIGLAHNNIRIEETSIMV